MGKNIRYYLMDNIANGRVKCTIANWTGISYRIPRVMLDSCTDRADLKQCGVYFLFGEDEVKNEQYVYVGQARIRKNGEGIHKRISEHDTEDYWNEAVAFIAADDSFGPTEISYLENRFWALAKDAGRMTVKNDVEPSIGHVTEEKESELEEFIEYAKICMGVLGYKIFDKPITASAAATPDSPVFRLSRNGLNARSIVTTDGLAVLEGSKISLNELPACPPHIHNTRQKYWDKVDENGILKETIPFKSPSGAACFVIGGAANGNTEWKTEDGITFGTYISEVSHES